MTTISPINRPHSLRVPLTEDELRMLHEIAADERRSLVEIVRHYIATEHARRFGDKKKGRR